MSTAPRHDAADPPRDLARYSRQIRCPEIGLAGQQAIKHAQVTIVGCGALGGAAANLLARAGVGFMRIIDRDFIEVDNLQRQTLYDERDIADCLPKAEAAARKLRRINSTIEVEAVVADLTAANIEQYCDESELLIDGTDNLETRFLLNDLAVERDVPWVYGACRAAEGLALGIIPRRTPCLRCIWDELPALGTVPTCDTAGILATTVNMVASFQVTEALKILMGRPEELLGLVALNAWTGRLRALHVQAAYDDGDCPCCKYDQYDYLHGDKLPAPTELCGRDAVQILPAEPQDLDFRRIEQRLPGTARAKCSEYMLRFSADNLAVTVFSDGRAIIQGTTDPAAARRVLAKYVGV